MKNIPQSHIKLLQTFFKSEEHDIETIYGGGSKRQYLRVKNNSKSAILCSSGNLEEVKDHIEISMFFESHSLPVPKIYGHIKEEGLVLFEDVGTLSLEKKMLENTGNEKETKDVYESVIRCLIKLQKISPEKCRPIREKRFDKNYYRWETNYFIESCVKNVFKLNIEDMEKLNREFDILAENLEKEKSVLVHRDFQSQNIYINRGEIVLLDFQGSRKGAAQYDLASLLYDPYVELSPCQRENLLMYYYEEGRKEQIIKEDLEDFMRVFYKISMQRLMQAMGAYGFISLVNGKKNFLKHIGPAKQRLMGICKKFPEFPEINRIIEKIVSSDVKC